MSAAEYYDPPEIWRLTEDVLNQHAQEIDTRVDALQAHIRGFHLRRVLGQVEAGQISTLGDYVLDTIKTDHGELVDTASPLDDEKRSHDKCLQQKHSQVSSQISVTTGQPDSDQPLLKDLSFQSLAVDDLPDGWIVEWLPHGQHVFVDSRREITSPNHPRQQNFNIIYQTKTDLVIAWQKYRARTVDQASGTGHGPPTIGLVALELTAKLREDRIATWWIEHPGEEQEHNMCRVCRHIDFDILLHQIDPYMYTPPIPLGTLRAISSNNRCSFCRLVCHTASIHLSHLPFKDMPVICRIVDDPDWNMSATRIRTICLEFLLCISDYRRELLDRARLFQILGTVEPQPEQKFNDNRLVKNQIDMGLVKSWLRECKVEHTQSSLAPNSFAASFETPETTNIHDHDVLIYMPCLRTTPSHDTAQLTVVDVTRDCLVDITPSARYIALSYVWGNASQFQNTKARDAELHKPQSILRLGTQIPKTIRDAMKAVTLLGEKHLWVDSLCIVQDDLDKKDAQISNMGNIYSGALVTIVGVHGDSANAGLPGVDSDSRTTLQRVEEVQGMKIANAYAYPKPIMQNSIWNSRGWTYEESELGRRYLFFLSELVYFSCNRRVCTEDTGMRDVGPWLERSRRVRAERQPIWTSYRTAVKAFTKRDLKFEGDIDNAFRGMLSLLQPAFKGDFLFGLAETELDLCLLWQPCSRIRRRINPTTGKPIFPSWSWEGWVGQVQYYWTNHLVDDLSRVEWHAINTVTGEAGYYTSDQLRAPETEAMGIWEQEQRRPEEPPYYHETSNPDIWCLHPTAPKEQRAPLRLIQPGSHSLQFKAWSAFFTISNTHSSWDDKIALCGSTRGGGTDHILCPFPILDAAFFIAGTVYIPAHLVHTFTTTTPQICELIVLSRRRGSTSLSEFSSGHLPSDPYPPPATPPSREDDLLCASDRVTLYPDQAGIERVDDKYDHGRYNPCKAWPLFNVMLVRKGSSEEGRETVERVAIGIVHVTAFMSARPVWKTFTLE